MNGVIAQRMSIDAMQTAGTNLNTPEQLLETALPFLNSFARSL